MSFDESAQLINYHLFVTYSFPADMKKEQSDFGISEKVSIVYPIATYIKSM